MCRLFAITSHEPLSPMTALEALDVMREGHDGSGVGLFLRDLAGPFDDMKDAPVLSGIFSEKGIRRLDAFMMEIGFMTKYKVSVKVPKAPPKGVPKRAIYLIRAYEYPEEWEDWSKEKKLQELLVLRLRLREMGRAEQDMIVFSFWPDVIMIKEIGDPMDVGRHLQLDRQDLYARVIMAQGRQNTNYAINLYACHPFFIEGYSTMTNGENTAFTPMKEYLESRDFHGYTGYQSDSEVFTHILHYTYKKLGLDIGAYKHIVTPLKDEDIEAHVDRNLLTQLKHTCRRLIIDGPNCVIGSLPDHSLFMVQDRKKLRPGVVGGRPGMFAFSSEICGLDHAIQKRDKSKDFQPMRLDTAIVGPDRQEVRICNQSQKLTLPH
ncbi:glutamate synthase [Desulfobacterales bacterium HSG16]|nr:glutamate synthase [Desulfobacterales bacterium HSG16]